MPLPVQDVAEWYAPGGRYWVLVWSVLGWEREGDKFLSATSLAWELPLALDDAARLWSELAELARQSDAWQLSQGLDATPQTADVDAMFARREASIWAKGRKNDQLIKFIARGYEALKEWRRRRSATPVRKPDATIDGGGAAVLILLLVAVAASGSTRRRRR